MALNPRYVTAPSLQSYFVSRDTGLPLSGGLVFTYSDNNRSTPKTVYELQGNQTNYTYVPLPNPIVLSAAGTIVDNNGNDIIPYWYPFDAEGNLELYYVVVQSSLGVPQFIRQAWPNPNAGESPEAGNGLINFIPNGQYLEHTDLPANTTPPHLLQPGINTIAQGGMYIRLDDDATSTNTLTYVLQGYTESPPQSPRYLANLVCSNPVGVENIKAHGVKFGDVNKFSAPPVNYTYGFWGRATSPTPFSVQVYKFFGTGGNPSGPETIAQFTGTLTTSDTFFNIPINFGTNAGAIIGTNQDDYVAIEIVFATDTFLNVSLDDHVLIQGDLIPIAGFPVQTNADMMARGVMGWADTVDPIGMDLYLPPILTKEGMTWDQSQIGDVGMSLLPISSPSSLPAPQNNKMAADGGVYISGDYASNGIPFQRLDIFLLSHPETVNDLPLFGTGPNYISALVNFSGSDTDEVRITWNSAGVGSPQAADSIANPTGFVFSPMFIYGGSTTGVVNPNTLCSNTGTDNLLLLSMQPGFSANARPAAGTSGFTITPIDTATQLLAFQGDNCASTILTVSGTTLSSGGTGHYWDFSSDIADFRMWYQTGAQAAPAAGGKTLIQVNIDPSYTAGDVADVTREGVLGYQSSLITISATPPQNSYFTFSANPGALRNFYGWFNINDNGIDPAPAGLIGVELKLPTTPTPTPTIIRDTIRAYLNRYQFQAPLFDGMFLRCADPNMIYDTDGNLRWSNVSGIGGAFPGTFEFSQFLSHTHAPASGTQFYVNSPSGNTSDSGPLNRNDEFTTAPSGGSETRPINAYIYAYIRY